MSIVYLVNFRESEIGIRATAKAWLKVTGVIFGISLIFSIVTPTTNQAAVIYCLPKIASNEQVQKIPNKLLELSNNWLDEMVEKTKDEVTEKTLEIKNN